MVDIECVNPPQASGGSGVYLWSVKPEGVVSVSSKGTLTTIARGKALASATDKKNTAHYDESEVLEDVITSQEATIV